MNVEDKDVAVQSALSHYDSVGDSAAGRRGFILHYSNRTIFQ